MAYSINDKQELFFVSSRFARTTLCTSDYEGSICEGNPFSRKAFYDPGASDGARDYRLVSFMGFTSLIISLSCQELRKLNTTDTRQMWSLIPAVQFQVSSRQERSSVVRCFLSFVSC